MREEANDVRLSTSYYYYLLLLNSVCSEIKNSFNFLIAAISISLLFFPPLPISIPTKRIRKRNASLFLQSRARITRVNILSSRTFDIPGSALIDISIDVYVHTCAGIDRVSHVIKRGREALS